MLSTLTVRQLKELYGNEYIQCPCSFILHQRFELFLSAPVVNYTLFNQGTEGISKIEQPSGIHAVVFNCGSFWFSSSPYRIIHVQYLKLMEFGSKFPNRFERCGTLCYKKSPQYSLLREGITISKTVESLVFSSTSLGTIKGRQIQEQQEQVLVFQRLKFYYNVRRTSEKSANGTLLGPATTLTSVFPHGDMFTTPVSGYEIEDETSARYVHLLFGLHERDLRKIETYFAPIILFAFVELEANWKDLVQDVRHGSLNSSLTLRDDIRHDLQTRLRPNPERATELNIEFSKGDRASRKLRIQINLDFYCRFQKYRQKNMAKTRSYRMWNIWIFRALCRSAEIPVHRW